MKTEFVVFVNGVIVGTRDVESLAELAQEFVGAYHLAAIPHAQYVWQTQAACERLHAKMQEYAKIVQALHGLDLFIGKLFGGTETREHNPRHIFNGPPIRDPESAPRDPFPEPRTPQEFRSRIATRLYAGQNLGDALEALAKFATANPGAILAVYGDVEK